MAYRLTQDEALSRGIKRIAREEIDSAIAQLSTRDPAKRDTAIHEARKSIKKLRGLVRMVAPVLGATAKTEVVALGELGRSLSEYRDAAAMVETVELLGQHCRSDEVLEQLSDLRRTLRRRAERTCDTAELRAALDHGIAGQRHLKRSATSWKLTDGFDLVAPGLEKSFRRGKKALKLARTEQTAVNFHDLRRRVKDRWYQTRILEGLWAHPAHAPERALRDLQEDLGDDHNLEVLRAYIPAQSAGLVELVDTLQRHLREKSLAAAALLYDRKAAESVQDLRTLWSEWRPAKVPVKSATAKSRTAAIA